jgi:hypothetical protein
MVKETPRTDWVRQEPYFPPESKRPQDERCKAGLEHNKPRFIGIDLASGPDITGYPDGMTRPDGSKQGDRDE